MDPHKYNSFSNMFQHIGLDILNLFESRRNFVPWMQVLHAHLHSLHSFTFQDRNVVKCCQYFHARIDVMISKDLLKPRFPKNVVDHCSIFCGFIIRGHKSMKSAVVSTHGALCVRACVGSFSDISHYGFKLILLPLQQLPNIGP